MGKSPLLAAPYNLMNPMRHMAENDPYEDVAKNLYANEPQTHVIERTNPKGEGQKFVGRCTRCGKEELTTADIEEVCP